MRILLNGEPRELADGASVHAVVAAVTDRTSGVAVAVNDAVVRRNTWDATVLHEADRVEVLTPMQGG